MEVRPIRSEKDYDQALQRVEALWNSALGSPQGDELESLVTLIEIYEREHYPMT
ncbi:MAG: hypothetical protein WAL85_12890 [Candidatus Korobacteraceae bacterium]